MGKRYNQSSDSKYQQFDDDFEDFGYEVKNIRRQTKKKVTKFKREVNEYDDTYWSGTLISHSSLDRVFYTCSRDFSFSMLTTGLRGELLLLDQLTPWEAKQRMEDHKRWEQEHREELEQNAQQLFDDMFGGW